LAKLLNYIYFLKQLNNLEKLKEFIRFVLVDWLAVQKVVQILV